MILFQDLSGNTQSQRNNQSLAHWLPALFLQENRLGPVLPFPGETERTADVGGSKWR